MPKPSAVKDAMRRNPVTIRADANIAEAIELIVEYKITGLTVTDDNGKVVGVLSEMDCLDAIISSIYNEGNAESALVSEAMTADVFTCGSTDSILDVAQEMLKNRHRRRPVVEGDGRLVGQISCNNILWALLEHSRRKSVPATH
jgi:CBS domain-containing protein